MRRKGFYLKLWLGFQSKVIPPDKHLKRLSCCVIYTFVLFERFCFFLLTCNIGFTHLFDRLYLLLREEVYDLCYSNAKVLAELHGDLIIDLQIIEVEKEQSHMDRPR